MKPIEDFYVPSHPDFAVRFVTGEYRSSLKSLKGFEKGDTLAVLTGLTKGARAYTTLQCGPGPEDHVELNSDFVYINHSCEPNAVFDLSHSDRAMWHIRALKHIDVGDDVTFFYPSTEWDMDQPFDCACGAASCLRSIQGAKYLSKGELLARHFINPWILKQLKARDGASI